MELVGKEVVVETLGTALRLKGKVIAHDEGQPGSIASLVTVLLGCMTIQFIYPTGNQVLSTVKTGESPLRKPLCKVISWENIEKQNRHSA